MRYVVLDRSGLCHSAGNPPGTGPGTGPTQLRFFPDPGLQADQVHRDSHTDTRVLPIEDTARNSFMGTDDDAERGKAGYDLRALLFGELSQLNAAPDGTPQVVVYGDDADKASGCGWFDGDYAGVPLHFNETYQAALCWLKRHPWVEVVTVVELDAGDATDLPAPLWSASCPSVDPTAATATDLYGNVMHFDTWYEQWRAWRSPWLGRQLGEISETTEALLVAAAGAAPGDFDSGLVDIAWMTFLALNHEMYWNKEALEGSLVDKRLGVLSPEDFVLAASLHLGLTRLYLCAARWATLAPTLGSATRVSDGKLVEDLAQRGLAGADGLHWDDDLLPNDLLYNDEVLVVLDRNGGRAIAIFTRTADGAVCVSGTPRAFQWTQPDPDPDPQLASPPWLTCDGNVLENSVLTPNHLYVASDLAQSEPRIGLHHEDRARQSSLQRWLYPDSFNEYEADLKQATGSVTYHYSKPCGPQPAGEVALNLFDAACKQDHEARAQGGEPVVWHVDGPTFSKTISLDGRRIRVAYDDAPAGHRVGNEFAVDLHSAMTGHGFPTRMVDPAAGTAAFTGADGARVTITPGTGCHLSTASLVADAKDAEQRGLSTEFLRLHRVLTDAVVIATDAGGTFDYTIEV